MLEKLAAENDKYAAFWSEFGKCLKEGVVEDPANREAVMKLLRFASTKDAETEARSATVSLADYVARAPKEQTKIYYLVAGSYDNGYIQDYILSQPPHQVSSHQHCMAQKPIFFQ